MRTDVGDALGAARPEPAEQGQLADVDQLPLPGDAVDGGHEARHFVGEALGVLAASPRVAVSMYPSMFQGAEEFMSPMFPLSIDDVRFVGDPVALIVAESRYVAEDAAELVEIDYEPLPPILTYDAALAGDDLVHPNRPNTRDHEYVDGLRHR